MKLRKALGTVVGGVGLAAVTNRVVSSKAGDLAPPLPGDHRTYRWRGFDVGYTEAGDPEDPDLVLFHGVNAAASSREFDPVFESLAEEYHVLAPDIPGFGTSDRPPILYSASLYQTFVTDFCTDLTDEPTVVGSGLSGAYVAIAAESFEAKRLVLICPTDTTMGGDSQRAWVRTLLRSPVVGQLLYNGIVSKRSMEHFHADHGYYDLDNLTDDQLDYEWQTAHQPGARFAPASFLGGYLDPEDSLEAAIGRLDIEVTLVWGRDASVTPLWEGRSLAESVDSRLVVFDDALLLPHVEHPAQFVGVLTGEHDGLS